jgi:hypothetical protein
MDDPADLPDPRELQRLPALSCGLYRSRVPLRHEGVAVPPDRLVYLHDHRPEEWPRLHLPETLLAGGWRFEENGFDVTDAAFLQELLPLPAEGWYSLRQAVHTGADGDAPLPARALVLVGYNRQGHCILFPAQFGEREVRFGQRGLRFADPAVLDALEPVNFEVPEAWGDRVVH